MKRKSYPLSNVYRLIESGPVVLVSTAYKSRFNVMAMSWHTMLEFEPPQLGCVISNRNYSFTIVRKTKECVINIPTVDIARKVVACGSAHGKRIDKFKTCGLTPVPAHIVKAPLIDECYVNLECRVINQKLVTEYNFFILEVVKAWMRPTKAVPRTVHHNGRGTFSVGGHTITIPSKIK